MCDWVVTAGCLHTLSLPATLLNFKGFLPCFLSLQFRKEILSVHFRGIQPNSFWSEIKADAHRWSEKEKENKTPNVNDLEGYCWTSIMCEQALSPGTNEQRCGLNCKLRSACKMGVRPNSLMAAYLFHSAILCCSILSSKFSLST